MRALLDVSDKLTVTQTTYAATPVYTLKAPNDEFILLATINIGADSTFLNSGKISAKINGNFITSQGAVSRETGLIQNLSLEFKERDFIFVEPQSSLDIDLRMTTGTGTVQIAVTGTIVTRSEFEVLRAKYLGLVA
jgi:hypothetical protein